ncbi:glycoside hydrolase family 29 [Segetibacter sp. 3557_3]|uniref:alpha-L-fucosidase n=1 Tax=Segetibacter sp. 3557_3 TaxID=2547429 RepID=UPI001058E7BD|nr:alpha-L-fucosidase [Segetibacter sp. 3557_3]TDH28614.1 glycoside hydrolase family 29 [Segetibacter sp. 3557_3]
MRKRIPYLLTAALILCARASWAQQPVAPPAPLLPLPTEKQMAWHEMEMNAFIHFTTNTFTGREWGNGDESEALFNPTALDVRQWTKTLKSAGFKGVILTAKHHDGFCLWPSKFTDHSVKRSPWKNGNGDVVKELSIACESDGLKFGVYLSPWDRNHAAYGQPAYINYYRNQLKELFTNYGPVFEMWFDGANGGSGYYGGANETRKINGATYYDWPTTLDSVRNIQPQVLFFSDAGPDLRWCGNENGTAGLTNWNTISNDTLYAGKPRIEGLLNTGAANGTKWIPAEVDVSIRPGWFYHSKEDTMVKTPERLFQIYLSSVGRGSTLLLNIPPDQRGLFHEKDVKALQGFRKLLDTEFKKNLAAKAKATATSFRGSASMFGAAKITDGKKETYWSTHDEVKAATININLGRQQQVKYIVLQEYIRLGQRISSFTVDVKQAGDWKQVAEGTTIGYKRIFKIDPVTTTEIRLNIKESKACPLISEIAIY